ncbi:hypothetical protein ABI59_09710 [Acidobacteria bacterium Mor1]|nr:hypothetical protein ABI59_09710 [Acidobacteria bacterium Mor1]
MLGWIRAALAAMVLGLTTLALAETPPPSAATLIDRYENLELAGSGQTRAVKDLEFELGRMRFRLDEGTAAPLLAGEQVIGFYFRGKGQYTYVSTEAAEHPPLRYLTRTVKLKPESGDASLMLRDRFDEMVFVGAGMELPDLGNTEAPSIASYYPKHREYFDKSSWTRIPGLLQWHLDAPDSIYAFAEIAGDKEPVRYTYDNYDNQSETLIQLDRAVRYGGEGRVFGRMLSSQPVGRSYRDFEQPLFLLRHVELDMTTSDRNRHAKLNVKETLVPHGRDQRVFNLSYRDRVFDRKDRPRPITVKVTDKNGNPVTMHHHFSSLTVVLDQPAPAGSKVELNFDIEGDFLIRPGSDNYISLWGSEVIPLPWLNGRYFTLRAKVEVEKPWTPLLPGQTLRNEETEDTRILETWLDRPTQYPVVMAGKYHIHEETFDDMTIRVASYAMKNKQSFRRLPTLAYKMIKFYEPFLGPFPYNEYNIIEINSYGFGIAPPATMYITQEAFDARREGGRGFNHVFAHEIAHQYWAHVVKYGSSHEQWLSESFAEYSSSFVVRKLLGDAAYRRQVGGWKREAKLACESASIPMANRLPQVGAQGSIHRTDLLYGKGPYLLYAIHKELGDDAFAMFLRNMQDRLAWKYATTGNVIDLLTAVSGNDYAPFFDQYFYGTELPSPPDP